MRTAGEDWVAMTWTSPRLDDRLWRAAEKLDDSSEPMAETWRKVGVLASELGLPRPGYDTIRRIVLAHRERRAEIKRLLDPVVADALQGRLSPWGLDRMIEASIVSRSGRRPGGR